MFLERKPTGAVVKGDLSTGVHKFSFRFIYPGLLLLLLFSVQEKREQESLSLYLSPGESSIFFMKILNFKNLQKKNQFLLQAGGTSLPRIRYYFSF
jgi:hypothetical protein